MKQKQASVKCCRMLSVRQSWSVTYGDGNVTPHVVMPLLVDPGFVGLSLRGCEMMDQKNVGATITRLRNAVVVFQTTCDSKSLRGFEKTSN